MTSQRTPSSVYAHYTKMYYLAGRKTARELNRVDSRLPLDMAAHCCHNWGSDEARALLKQRQHIEHAITERMHREFARAEHSRHGADNCPHYCELPLARWTLPAHGRAALAY